MADLPGDQQTHPTEIAAAQHDPFFDRVISLSVLAILILSVFQITRPFISSILWGTIVAVATWPAKEFLARVLGGPRRASSLMSLLLVLIVGIPVTLLASSLIEQVGAVADLVADLTKLPPPPPPDWLKDLPFVGEAMDRRWRLAIEDLSGTLARARPWILSTLQWALGTGVGLLGALGEVLLAVLVTCILYFNGLAAGAMLRRFVLRLGGEPNRHLLEVAVATIRAVAVGVVGAALVQGVLAAVGLIVAGVPGAILLGLLIFVGAIAQLPGGILMLPLAGWLYLQGSTTAAIGLAIWAVAVVGMVDNVIRPLVIGRSVDLPITLIFVGVVGGLLAYGFIGIFLGATILAVIYALLKAWLDSESAESPKVG